MQMLVGCSEAEPFMKLIEKCSLYNSYLKEREILLMDQIIIDQLFELMSMELWTLGLVKSHQSRVGGAEY